MAKAAWRMFVLSLVLLAGCALVPVDDADPLERYFELRQP